MKSSAKSYVGWPQRPPFTVKAIQPASRGGPMRSWHFTPGLTQQDVRATMQTMHLVQIILPLYGTGGQRLGAGLFAQVRQDLVDNFGGVTAFTRSPAEGLWQDGSRVERDDVVLYEVMVESLDHDWWRAYRQDLEARFQQQELVIRAHAIERF